MSPRNLILTCSLLVSACGEDGGVIAPPGPQPVDEVGYVSIPSLGRIEVLDMASHTVRTTIELSAGVGEVFLTPSGDYAYVGHASESAGTYTVIDTETHLPIQQVAFADFAKEWVFTPDGRRAYVRHSRSFSLVDLVGHVVLSVIPSSSPNPMGGIALSPDGSYIYASHGHWINASGHILVFDAASLAEVARVSIGGLAAPGVTFTPNGSKAYASASNGTEVRIVDAVRHEVTKTIVVGDSPAPPVFTPDGTAAYVPVMPSDLGTRMAVIDTETESLTATVPGEYVSALVFTRDGNSLFAVRRVDDASSGSSLPSDLVVIDTRTHSIVTSFEGTAWGDPVLSPTGDYLAALNRDADGEMVLIDTGSNSVVVRVPVGSSARLDWSPDGTTIYIGSDGSDGSTYNVTAWDVASRSVIAATRMDGSPSQVLFIP